MAATPKKLTRDQKSLLLYLETLVVDNSGKITDARMNATDWTNLAEWTESGFVRSGRIAFEDIKTNNGYPMSHWVELSDEAWAAAHQLRRERSAEWEKKRTFRKTTEDDAPAYQGAPDEA